MATTNATTERTTSDRATSDDEGLVQTARHMADTVAAAAGEATARIPEVARSTREAASEASRLVHSGSDATLRLVGATSIGFAVGLLVGGANRILVIASLLPAALIGATIVERMEGGGLNVTRGATTDSGRVQGR